MLSEQHTQHLLSDLEKERFERDGFITLDNVLDAHQITHYRSMIDAIYAQHLQTGFDPYANDLLRADQSFFYPDILGCDQTFIDLLDHPRVFPKVLGILGWNIYSYHTHFLVTPPKSATQADLDQDTARDAFHQNSGRASLDVEVRPPPHLTVKTVYWLSDVSEPGRGNLQVVPGSHWRDPVDLPAPGVVPPDAVAICAKPGDVLLFDRRLWHSSSPNYSNITRKGLFYAYGYRWLRAHDEMTISDDIMRGNDPVRRQLLGYSRTNHHRFSPDPEDTPIKAWLEAQQ